MLKFFRKFNTRLRHVFFWLQNQDDAPGHSARGLAIGVFCGCFPLFGFQTILGLVLAKIFKSNQLLAATGTWISNPLTYLPIYWFNYQVGSALLGTRQKFYNFSALTSNQFWLQGWQLSLRLIIGSFLVGLTAAFITGIIVYFCLRNSKKSKQH